MPFGELVAPVSNKEESHATALSLDFEGKEGSPCCLDQVFVNFGDKREVLVTFCAS